MRILKTVFTVVLTASFLVACGGSSSDTNTVNTGGSGVLVAAYSKINGGMSYQQVRDIIGFDYKQKSVIGAYSTSYIWQTGNIGQSDFAMLTTEEKGKGVSYKSISSVSGKDSLSDSKSYPAFY
jgi:hypothetical protein